SVLPVFSYGVKRVDHSQNAGGHRNLFAGLAVGIAAAIPALVMMTDYRDNRVREVDPLHDLGSDHGVDLHLLEFGGAELPRFVEDVVGHRDLSDVVQQCACLERFDLGLSKSEMSCESGGIHPDAIDVIVSDLILCVDRGGERLDRCEMDFAYPLAGLRSLVSLFE